MTRWVGRGRLLAAIAVACGLGGAVAAGPAAAAVPVQTTNLNGLSCPSISLCVFVTADSQGVYASTDPTAPSPTWTAVAGGLSTAPGPLFCASTSLCLVGDASDVLFSTDPMVPSSWTGSSGLALSQAITCASTSLCLVASRNGLFVSADPTATGSWTQLTPNQYSAVSCPTTALCIAVGSEAVVTAITNPAGDAGETTTTVPSAHQLLGLSCPSVQLCVAVDNEGFYFVSTNPAAGTWTQNVASTVPSGSYFRQVACPTTTLCLTVGSGNPAPIVYSTDPADINAAWPTLATVPGGQNGEEFISCPESGMCTAASAQTGSLSVGLGAKLNVALTGSGTVTDSNSYINCGSTCTAYYEAGTSTTLTAVPSPGWTFTGWNGDGCVATTPCTITTGAAGSSASVTAAFAMLSTTSKTITTIRSSTVSAKKKTARFNFSANSTVTSYKCALSRVPKPTKHHKHPTAPTPSYSTCTPPKTYKHLKAGTYVFYVRAIAPDGNTGTPSSERINIA
jgi:uncharacterized repeat protein (TIGR02543 family)